MTHLSWFLAAVVLLAAVAGAAMLAFRDREPVITQPIAFDHARHAQELGCIDCHKTAESRPHAGLPLISTCMLCHATEQGEHPDEPKIREYAERGEQIPWVRVNRLDGHVYFSHAMHVKIGGMECAACHGDMASATAPPTRSQVRDLTMSRCMSCHAERGATNDCLACHK